MTEMARIRLEEARKRAGDVVSMYRTEIMFNAIIIKQDIDTKKKNGLMYEEEEENYNELMDVLKYMDKFLKRVKNIEIEDIII